MKLDVIVPSFNNNRLLTNMVNSLTRIGFFKEGDRRLIIVNNGKQPCDKDYKHIIETGFMKVISPEENLGWEGGLLEGLKNSEAEFVCFQNDDTHIPQSEPFFYDGLMLSTEGDVGLSGPITNCAAGIQSIYDISTPIKLTEVTWLIFFCVMMKRATLDSVGGIDTTLPGGDDIDLSIRMRKAGKKLYVNPSSFIYHHGFQTGERVNGGPEVEGGWNSRKMMERTNQALIRKHGFRAFYETLKGQVV